MKFFILFAFTLLCSISSKTDAASDLFEQARILYNEARFAEAISLYQEIIKDKPQDIKAYLNLAYLYKDLAEYEQAIEVIIKAIEFFKDNRLNMLLGRLYYLNGKPEEAISQLSQLLPPHSEDPQVLLYLGLCYEDIGKPTKAEEFYLDVIRIKPNNVLANLKLGNIYYGKQKFKQARQIYQKVISLDPSITEVRPRLAECAIKLDEFEEAYRQYAKCVAIRPQDKLLRKRLEETKIKLGEDFFKRKDRLALKRRKKKSIQVEPHPFALRAPEVRIGIAKIKDSVEFKCGSPFEIVDKQNGNSLFKGRAESIYTLLFNKKAGIQLKDSQENVLLGGLDKPFLIKNKSENTVITIFDLSYGIGEFWAGWQDIQYRGKIEAVSGEDGFQLINIVNLEEYLYGVLPSEMPVNWPKQALYAQAIAARTWAMRNKNRHHHEGFNFCSTVHCQVYKGAGAEAQLTNQAVDETTGIIITSSNQPIDVFYSNNCGGLTRDGILDSDSADFYFPFSPSELEDWFRGEPNTFCNLKDQRLANFRWVRRYKQEQLQAMLSKSDIDIRGPIKITPQKRASSGHLVSIKIDGIKNSKVIEGENNIRKTLGDLLSSAFKIEVKYDRKNGPEEFVFYGGGFGHGRGLCQAGIKGMALRDYNYLKILKHYYPETEIQSRY